MNLYQFLKKSLQEIRWERSIFCGYSGNLDWVVSLQNDQFLRFEEKMGFWPDSFSKNLCIPEIYTIPELINYVTYFMHTASGGEGDLKKMDLVEVVMQSTSGYFSIGGTGAQAANFLAHLGLSHVHLHLPIYNAYFAQVLHPNLHVYHNTSFYAKEMGKEIVSSLSEVHCIFDYAMGTLYRIGNKVFKTRRSDRIILSYDRCNSNLHISEAFKKELLKPKKEISFLVSGFNSLRKTEDLSRFVKKNQLIIEQFRKTHPKASICVEEAHYWDKEKERIETVAKNIYPMVDSVSMNVREFQTIRRCLGFQNRDPVEALHAIASKYGIRRVGVHSGENCIVVSTYPLEQEILADSLGILLSGAKAYYGRFVGREELEKFLVTFRDFACSKEIPVPKPLGGGYQAFIIPTLKGIPIVSTLGLGDAFAAGLLVYL
jgi:ADP-dependent phosphofructokinase/glucokinase